MLLSIIIVNYNVKHFLLQCLRSIYASAVDFNFEVLVLDNCSTDGSKEYLEKHCNDATKYPNLHLLFNTQNLGFGKANNLGLAQAKGKYILYLNPDVILGKHTLQQCVSFCEQGNKAVGVLGVKMLKANGGFALESRRGLPTPFTCFCKFAGLTTLFPKSHTFGRYYLQFLNRNESHCIDIVSGAFMLGTREALCKEGGFDEAFFMYGEDIDLSYRLQKRGLRNYYLPASILHYKGESTVKNSWKYVNRFYGAMLIFFRKHYPNYNGLFTLFIQTCIYLTGGVTLLKGVLTKLKRLVVKPKQSPSFPCTFVTSQVNLTALRSLLSSHSLFNQATCCTLNEVQQNQGKEQYLVFDASCHTYDEMLHFIETHAPLFHLGVYYPQEHIVILPKQVVSLGVPLP